MTRPDRCPYGWWPYFDDDKRLMESPAEQDVIAHIRKEAETGKGARKIARGLTAAGILCRGRPWRRSSIVKILARAAVCG